MEYEEFKKKVLRVLKSRKKPFSWKEVKAKAGFKQKVPNNQWVRRLEKDIGLIRERSKEKKCIIWRLNQ